MATLINTKGAKKEVSAKAERFDIVELQGFVGGFIEIVRLPKAEKFLVVNEEGKIQTPPLAFNREATEMFQQEYPTTKDYIVGNALLCSYEEVD